MKTNYSNHPLNPLRQLGGLLMVVFGLTAASISVDGDQTPPTAGADKSAKARIAVIEFTPGTNAAGMTYEAKRHLQASIAFSLQSSGRFSVVDVRNTRDVTQRDLSELNGSSSAPAARIGKQLNVSYILTGNVIEYDTKSGRATLNTRLIEVATGEVKYSGETTEQSTSPMTARAGEPEMMAKVLKPAIAKLTTALTGSL
ncbi:MAG: FlgO family outer membrane protein [Verrucomicrobiota bacterium]